MKRFVHFWAIHLGLKSTSYDFCGYDPAWTVTFWGVHVDEQILHCECTVDLIQTSNNCTQILNIVPRLAFIFSPVFTASSQPCKACGDFRVHVCLAVWTCLPISVILSSLISFLDIRNVRKTHKCDIKRTICRKYS